MDQNPISKSFKTLMTLSFVLLAAPLTASLQAGTSASVLPLAQVDETLVVDDHDHGFPWGLLGLLGLIGLAGLKKRDDDKSHQDRPGAKRDQTVVVEPNRSAKGTGDRTDSDRPGSRG